MVELFVHDLSVRAAVDTEDVYVINGKDWNGNPFKIFINEYEAKTLLWQLNFFVSDTSS